MTDIEKIAEEIIRAAARDMKGSIQYEHGEESVPQERQELENILSSYGAITHYYDGVHAIRFDINEHGRQLLVEGGFEQLRHNQELREKEVEATVSAADSAKKSATCAQKSADYAGESNQIAKRANMLSAIAIIIAIAALAISIVQVCLTVNE